MDNERKSANARLGPRFKYEELSRDEVLSLKDGDVVFMDSSWGIRQATYPHLAVETHRNLWWSDKLTELGYEYPANGAWDKTLEMLRDWGPLYKKILLPEDWEE